MPEFCSCGAQLPPDARFCHKCGKPQREEPPQPEAELPQPPAPPPQPAAEETRLPIGFHNRIAVWIALRVGVMAFLLSVISGVFFVVWLVAGGFFAVFLYRRRTGQQLSVMSGAHLGWLAGIFGFVIIMIFATIFIAALTQPEFVDQARQQWKALSISEGDINRILELLHSPTGIGSVLGLFFLAFSLLPAFGGAVGAKLLNRGR